MSQCTDIQLGGISGLNELISVKHTGFPNLMILVLADYYFCV